MPKSVPTRRQQTSPLSWSVWGCAGYRLGNRVENPRALLLAGLLEDQKFFQHAEGPGCILAIPLCLHNQSLLLSDKGPPLGHAPLRLSKLLQQNLPVHVRRFRKASNYFRQPRDRVGQTGALPQSKGGQSLLSSPGCATTQTHLRQMRYDAKMPPPDPARTAIGKRPSASQRICQNAQILAHAFACLPMHPSSRAP